jgi:hypothetical protein
MRRPLLVFWFLSMCLAKGSLADTLRCALEKVQEDGTRGVSAVVQIDEGQLRALSIESFYAAPRGSVGWMCYASSNDANSSSKWRISPGNGAFQVSLTGSESSIVVRPREGGYQIDLNSLNGFFCGPGGQWPSSIVVYKGAEECVVQN